MTTTRRLKVIGVALALMLASAVPAMAGSPVEKHRSCQVFGSVIWAGFAQAFVPSGQIIADNTHGFEAPWGSTYSGPGTIADIVHDEMTQVDFDPDEDEELFGCEEF